MAAARRRTPATPDLPEVLQSVTLRAVDGPGGDVSSKVLDVETASDGAATVVVARPPAGSWLAELGQAVVTWTVPRGLRELPVLVAGETRAYGPVWALTPTGRTVRAQRRAYYRAALPAPVRVSWDGAPPGAAPEPAFRDGVAVDVSEGGVLAVLRGDPPSPGTEVDVAIRLDGESLTSHAFVVRRVALPGGGRGVALRFADPAVHGDRLRKAVFAADRRRAHDR